MWKTLMSNNNNKEKLLGNIGSWHHQTSGDERKKLKSMSGEPESYTRQNYRVGTLSKR